MKHRRQVKNRRLGLTARMRQRAVNEYAAYIRHLDIRNPKHAAQLISEATKMFDFFIRKRKEK